MTKAKQKIPAPGSARKTAVRQIGPGALIEDWQVFPDEPTPITSKDGQPEPEHLFERRRKVWEQYKGITIDVRRLDRKRVRMKQAELDAASSLFDEIDLDDDSGDMSAKVERRRKATEIALGVSEVFAGFLKEQVKDRNGKALGPVLHRVHGVVVELGGGEELDLADVHDVEDLVYYLEEADMLESVGQAALRAQEPSEHQLRL